MINHIAFIMDGNRRYAKKKKLLLKEGYKDGMNKFFEFVKLQIKYEIKTSSFFVLSSENYFKRPDEEKKILFELVRFFSTDKKFEEFFVSNKIKIKLIGDIEEVKKKEKLISFGEKTFIEELEETIKEWNEKIKIPKYKVNLAINYNGQKEIVNSVKKIVKKIKLGEISENKIDEKLIKQNLWFDDDVEPEIIVRSGNAPRLSGFCLWDSQYSEIYLTEKLWPEMNEKDFGKILEWYGKIQRNFGK